MLPARMPRCCRATRRRAPLPVLFRMLLLPRLPACCHFAGTRCHAVSGRRITPAYVERGRQRAPCRVMPARYMPEKALMPRTVASITRVLVVPRGARYAATFYRAWLFRFFRVFAATAKIRRLLRQYLIQANG